MRHDGIQEECSDEETDQSIIKHMTQNGEEKPKRIGQRSAQRKNELPDGTLQGASLERVNDMLATMEAVSAQMTEDLEAAQNSTVVGPAMITICQAVKRKFDAAVLDLKFHKTNNKDVNTPTVLKVAKLQVTDSRKQFSILRKILNLQCPVNQAACEGV